MERLTLPVWELLRWLSTCQKTMVGAMARPTKIEPWEATPRLSAASVPLLRPPVVAFPLGVYGPGSLAGDQLIRRS